MQSFMTKQPPQSIIESRMREICSRGNYEMVHLFSNEGLPLAGFNQEYVITEDRLAELSLLLRKVRDMADLMGKISNVKEMIVEGYNHRKVIFRFFPAFDQEVVLAVVVPPRKAYRSLTNALIKLIENIEF